MAEYGKNDAPNVLDNNPDINNYKEIKPDEKISFDECDKIWKDLFSVDKLEELSLDLEGKDTRVYDYELIKKIPDILGDKWGYAKKKFKIIKK